MTFAEFKKKWSRYTGKLEFRGTIGGPWDRFIDPTTIEEITLPRQKELPEKERKNVLVKIND